MFISTYESSRKLNQLVFAAAVSLMSVASVNAADHQEAPGASARLSADIGDYYVWHEEEQLNLVLTFGTFAAPGLPASFNRDNLYTFHFDTSAPADGVADLEIYTLSLIHI